MLKVGKLTQAEMIWELELGEDRKAGAHQGRQVVRGLPPFNPIAFLESSNPPTYYVL